MNRALIINEINKDVDLLNDNELQEVFRFVRYIKIKEEIDPNIEIIENEDFIESINAGINDKIAGKVYNWDDVK